MKIGPLSRVIQDSDNHIKALSQTELEKQLMHHVSHKGVELKSNAWIVTANKR